MQRDLSTASDPGLRRDDGSITMAPLAPVASYPERLLHDLCPRIPIARSMRLSGTSHHSATSTYIASATQGTKNVEAIPVM
jgi:hypothetical protein